MIMPYSLPSVAGSHHSFEQFSPGTSTAIMTNPLMLSIGMEQKDSWFSHIAVEVPGENCSNE